MAGRTLTVAKNHYVLVCGGRDFKDREAVFEVLQVLHWVYGPALRVMHGAARGADSLAGGVARQLGVPEKGFPADWEMHGKGAGPIRNRHMCKLLVDWRDLGHSVQVVAFPGGNGTRDMCEVAEKAGIDVDRIGFSLP